MAAAGRIVESMNRNIDAMEQEKSILRKLARLLPEQARQYVLRSIRPMRK